MEERRVGDIVAYRDLDKKEIQHVGILSSIETMFEGRSKIYFVWSMWGNLGESLHRHTECPYPFPSEPPTERNIEYWRLKDGFATH